MSDDTDIPVKGQVPVQSVLQIVTLLMLGTGGFVAKSGYDDISQQLTEARIEASALREAVKNLGEQRAAADADAASVRAQAQAMDLRLTALEVRERERDLAAHNKKR